MRENVNQLITPTSTEEEVLFTNLRAACWEDFCGQDKIKKAWTYCCKWKKSKYSFFQSKSRRYSFCNRKLKPADIAILLNRDRSAVSRTLAKMAADEEWHIRLSVLRRDFGRSASTPIYAYRQEIFDLIVDYYEEDYLRRFIRPRRGRPRNEEEAREVRRYWNHLKDAARAAPERFWEESDPAGLPDIPPMGFKEALRLILSKVLTLRTGALFTVLFALGYELSRRWPALFLWLPAVAVLVFFACIPLLRRGKFNPAHVASLGAGGDLVALQVRARLGGLLVSSSVHGPLA